MKTEKVKAAMEKKIASCEGNERGLMLVHTGNGKGKTSAAMNMVYRHLIHDMPVVVVQFVKAQDEYPDGDRLMLTRLKEIGFPITISTLGRGFSWNTPDVDANRAAAAHALEQAKQYLLDDETRLVLLDEIHIAVHLDQIEEERVLDVVKARTPDTHVILTGRYAPKSFIESADLVTEMKLVKHPMQQKIPAQKGIEF